MTEEQIETQFRELGRAQAREENLREPVDGNEWRGAITTRTESFWRVQTLGPADDPTGAAADLVEQYMRVDLALKKLERQLSQSMIARQDDEGYLQRCYATHAGAVKSANDKKRAALAQWQPDFCQQFMRPN
jgi:hypothetical protein